MLSFESEQFLGATQIVEKLVVSHPPVNPRAPYFIQRNIRLANEGMLFQGLRFQKVTHQVVTCDCQPTTAATPNGIIVFVNGNLIIDEGANPMKFAQCFHLLPDPSNPANYWVHNDIFRLNLG